MAQSSDATTPPKRRRGEIPPLQPSVRNRVATWELGEEPTDVHTYILKVEVTFFFGMSPILNDVVGISTSFIFSSSPYLIIFDELLVRDWR